MCDPESVREAISRRRMSLGPVFVLSVISLVAFLPITTGLHCYECLSLTCDSLAVCESAKASMSQIFSPRRQNIEFNPNETCPDLRVAPRNSTKWAALSRECTRTDSVCLEANIEVVSSFSGLKDSLRLQPFSSMTSKGILRGCASRRFLLGVEDETLDMRLELGDEPILAQGTDRPKSTKDKYTVTHINSHHFYIDHATPDSVRCYEDNCNLSMRTEKNSASSLNRVSLSIFVPIFLILFQIS